MDKQLSWYTNKNHIEMNDVNEEEPSENVTYELTAYKMKNFKAFHDSDWIEFSSIVLFYGDNSAGKTTIRQPFLLLEAAYVNERRQINCVNLSELCDDSITEDDFLNKRYPGENMEISFMLTSSDSKCVYTILMHVENDASKYRHLLIYNRELIYLDEYFDASNVFFLMKKENMNIPRNLNSIVIAIMVELKNFCQRFSYMQATRIVPERLFVFNQNGYSDIQRNGLNTYNNLFSSVKNGVIENQFVQDWVKEFGFELEWQARGKMRAIYY